MTRCDVCNLGVLRTHKTTYSSWWRGHLVVLPDVLTWICDVCGETTYETDTIIRVELLLGDGLPAPSERAQVDTRSEPQGPSMHVAIDRRRSV